MITWEDFESVHLCVGTIVRAEEFPEARKPAYKLWVDVGEGVVRQSSAQITHLYTLEGLIGKQVLCVTNFPPKKIGQWMSEILVTGFYQADGTVVLASPDLPLPNGTRLA